MAKKKKSSSKKAAASAAGSGSKSSQGSSTDEKFDWLDDGHELVRRIALWADLELFRGNTAYSKGRYAEAVRRYTQCIALTVQDSLMMVQALHNRSLAYLQLGLYQLALQDVDTSLSLNTSLTPRSLSIELRRIVLLFLVGEYERAATLLCPLVDSADVQHADTLRTLLGLASLEATEQQRRIQAALDTVKEFDADPEPALLPGSDLWARGVMDDDQEYRISVSESDTSDSDRDDDCDSSIAVEDDDGGNSGEGAAGTRASIGCDTRRLGRAARTLPPVSRRSLAHLDYLDDVMDTPPLDIVAWNQRTSQGATASAADVAKARAKAEKIVERARAQLATPEKLDIKDHVLIEDVQTAVGLYPDSPQVLEVSARVAAAYNIPLAQADACTAWLAIERVPAAYLLRANAWVAMKEPRRALDDLRLAYDAAQAMDTLPDEEEASRPRSTYHPRKLKAELRQDAMLRDIRADMIRALAVLCAEAEQRVRQERSRDAAIQAIHALHDFRDFVKRFSLAVEPEVLTIASCATTALPLPGY